VRRYGVTVSLCVRGVVTLGGVTIGYAVFFALNYDNVKPSFPVRLIYLPCFVALLFSFLGCRSRYEGTYHADIKLVSGNDPCIAMLGGGKESETAETWIYVTCHDRGGYYVSRIGIDEDSTLYVNIGLMGDGPFVNKHGSIRRDYYCGPYPGVENVQICVRPYKKI
jgi:hypothetical protein